VENLFEIILEYLIVLVIHRYSQTENVIFPSAGKYLTILSTILNKILAE